MDFEHMDESSCLRVPSDDQWPCVIYPVDEQGKATARGLMICEPHAVGPLGPWVRFDSKVQGIDYGKSYIVQEFLRYQSETRSPPASPRHWSMSQRHDSSWAACRGWTGTIVPVRSDKRI